MCKNNDDCGSAEWIKRNIHMPIMFATGVLCSCGTGLVDHG